MGLDFARGDHLLDRGTRLCPRTILLAVAAGHATLPVTRKPRVAVLATGNELVEPGATLDDGQIVGSNSYGIAAMVEAAGGAAQILGIAGDSEAKIDEAIRAANTADILLTSGGASVGDHDLVRPALQHAGANLVLYKVAMRPGKPMFYGTRMSAGRLQRCLGLPGNPVSAMIVARIFLVPLMRALLGQPVEDAAVQVRLAVALPGNGPRDHYIRAKLDRSMNPPTATPMANQDSSLIATLARADCLLRIPAGSPPLAAGAHVDALHIDF